MFGRLFALFLIVPLLDLALLVAVGERIGFWPTLAVVVLTAATGSWLAKREGLAAWQRVQQKMTSGGVPGPELIDGLLILIAGTLLLTPGFLTDLAGLVGLFPPTRSLLRSTVREWFEQSVATGKIHVVSGGLRGGPVGSPFAARPPIVEDAEVIDDGAPPEGR